MMTVHKRAVRAAARLAPRFRDDTSGNVAIIFALVGVVLMLAIGAAVDVGRWLHARDQTVAAVDAAVLAGGRALQTNGSDKSAAIAAAKKYYDENVTSRLSVIDDSVTFTVAPDGMGIDGQRHGLHQDAVPAVRGDRQAAVDQHVADRFRQVADRSRRQRRREHRSRDHARYHRLDVQHRARPDAGAMHQRPQDRRHEGRGQGSRQHHRLAGSVEVHLEGVHRTLLRFRSLADQRDHQGDGQPDKIHQEDRQQPVGRR